MSLRYITSIEPKFKFGQKVRIKTDFYGNLEGTVEAVAEQKKWVFWPFKSRTSLIYQITAIIDGEEFLVIVPESEMQSVPEPLRPVRK